MADEYERNQRLAGEAGGGGGGGVGYQNAAPVNYDHIDASGGQFSPMEQAGKRRQVTVLGRVLDYDLLVVKAFYFFFYAAFGSLFPLIGIYFKQLGMNATQAGFLIGIRPFLEYASTPFWGSFADRFKKGKILLLFSLACWIFFTLALSWIQPGTPYCLAHNTSGTVFLAATRSKRAAVSERAFVLPSAVTQLHNAQTADVYYLKEASRVRRDAGGYSAADFRPAPRNAHLSGMAPGLAPVFLDPSRVRKYDVEEMGVLVNPRFSTRVYRQSAVEEVFMLMLLVVCLGEFFSAPAMGLVDSCTLNLLADQPELYGKQRIWGSVGWGLAMFIVGLSLDHSSAFPNHPCGELEINEKNYTMCFATFSILMACAFLAATQLTFPQEQGRTDEVTQKIMDANVPYVDQKLAEKAKAAAPAPVDLTLVNGPKWFGVLRTFGTPHYAAFLFVVWWMGFGVGLVFSFLFWHLQDLGGSTSLFGIASVINHVSEVAAYFFSFRLINRIGHVKVMYMGLIANSFRFLYVSWLSDPWWVLPFEFVQGISHAAVWAAATSYISLAAPAEQKAQAQGILQGLHHGFGKGCGALIGGIVITYKGTRTMFVAYAVVCLLIYLVFFIVNRFAKPPSALDAGADLGLDGTTLAPHGVPAMGVDVNDRFGRPQQPPAGYQNAPAPDPQQAAYDAYVAGSAYEKPVKFDSLPSGPARR